MEEFEAALRGIGLLDRHALDPDCSALDER
jgi:hypothetical protein